MAWWPEQAKADLEDAERRLAHLKLVTACLLDHYLGCYDMNHDFLSLEAERLVPNWRQLKDNWNPTSDKP